MKYLTFKQRGDTIIEVMIAMSVMGVVLATAFTTANRSLAVGRSAQERSEAIEITETQLELIRSAIRDSDSNLHNALKGHDDDKLFCINQDSESIVIDFKTNNQGTIGDGTDGNYPAGCTFGPDSRYGVSIKKTGNNFVVQTKWIRFQGGGTDEVKMYYRTYTSYNYRNIIIGQDYEA